ncbi:MAG: CHASE domain-containing protein [Salinarimonas sp.]|nr:CHASE domain-containing protein [Salinarimonas sp.]
MKKKRPGLFQVTARTPRALIFPAIVVIAGIVATLFLGHQYERLARERDEERFVALVDQRAAAVTQRMEDYIALLRGTTALMASRPLGEVSLPEFRRYVTRLRIPELYPGVQGIGFARAVAPQELGPLEARMRLYDGDFRLWPEGERDAYSAIIFLEPQDERNRAAIGYDMFSEPKRRDAMERARDRGRRATTERVALVQEIEEDDLQPGFLIYLPIYRGGRIPDTVAERREQFIGWIYSPFRSGDLFDRSFELRERPPEITFAVFDGESTDDSALLYRDARMDDADPDISHQADRVVQIGDRLWTLRIKTTPAFAADSARALYPWLLGAGFFATLLLGLATLGQARATVVAEEANDALEEINDTLEQRVEKRTAQLERARAKLAGLIANLEHAVAARTADLTEANEEIQRFAYIVSHDLRAPLVNVMGFTAELDAVRKEVEAFIARVAEKAPELVTEDARVAVETDLPEALDFIRSSTQRMDRLIAAILKLSREGRRVLTPEPIVMREVIAQLEANITHQLDEEGAEIVIEEMPDLVSDRVALEQIFGNVIENAVKYLDPTRPGRITVRGRAEPDHTLRYEIEDNGRGIDPKDHQRVFDLFRRAGTQDKAGEGIGLAHVRALVRRLGGSIHIESEPGKGSTFIVTLPKTLKPDEHQEDV